MYTENYLTLIIIWIIDLKAVLQELLKDSNEVFKLETKNQKNIVIYKKLLIACKCC